MSEDKVVIIPEVEAKKSSYFQDVKKEFTKITWISKAELILYSKVVLGATFFMGFAIYFADVVVQRTLQMINFIGRWIIG